MSNKDKLKTLDNLLLSRLNVLLKDVNSYFQKGSMILDSELNSLYHSSLDAFYQSLDSSLLDINIDIKTGLPADPTSVNDFLSLLQKQLDITFSEVGILDRILSSSFNSILMEKEEILQTSKRIASKTGDYLLYSDSLLGEGYFHGDSFSTTDKIDENSPLLEGDMCFQSTEEGAVFLPLEGDPVRPEIKEIIINKTSNGSKGNNFELNSSSHSSIEALADGEPDTWFEYEIVSNEEIGTPLILDITISLKEISIINNLHINPINFGSLTSLELSVVETSKDGKKYSSIKEDFPIKDYVSHSDGDDFNLSAKSSNYTGQGYFSFLARKAQFIHLVFKQATPYQIKTINGDKLRYAIGIRDINLYSRKFKQKGSLISSSFSSPLEIKKLSLFSIENPIEKSELADISHFVSYEDGASWLQIQPQNRDSFLISEILNFNTIDKNSIETTDAVTSLRHKIYIERNKEAFSGNIITKKEEVEKLEILPLPSIANTEVAVKEEPISNSIQLIMPYLGSYSCPFDNKGSSIKDNSTPMDLDFVEFSIDSSSDSSLKYSLPFSNIPSLEQKIRVFINGSQIEYCSKNEDLYSSGNGTSYSVLDGDSRVYFLNKNGRELQFRTEDSSGNKMGFIPPVGSKIKVCLDGDNPFLELTDSGYVLNLTSPSDGSKETTSILALESIDENNYYQYEIKIPNGVKLLKDSSAEYTIGDYLEIDTPDNDISKYRTVEGNQTFDSLNNSMSLPVFVKGINNFSIKEYDSSGKLIIGDDRQFTTKTSFIDGKTELELFPGAANPNSYTFDPSTGTVYLGTNALAQRETVLVCKKLKINNIFPDKWNFVKENNKINTQKIILDPKEVYTTKKEIDFSYSPHTNSIKLINSQNDFSWYNSKLIKGTVKLSSSLFSINSIPTELSFIDGKTEFSEYGEVKEETISFTSVAENIWEFTLSEITSEKILSGSPTFNIIRSSLTSLSPENAFSISGQKKSFSLLPIDKEEGSWAVETENGVSKVRLFLSSSPASHSVSYRYKDLSFGVRSTGTYSIDYKNAIVYFSDYVSQGGNISFEVSNYSVFYNIGNVLSSKNIKEIKDKKISFTPSFLIKFLKQDNVQKSRPQIMKVLYSYYKTETESLADLEPYFSPVCKNIAFRAITSDLLGEL